MAKTTRYEAITKHTLVQRVIPDKTNAAKAKQLHNILKTGNADMQRAIVQYEKDASIAVLNVHKELVTNKKALDISYGAIQKAQATGMVTLAETSSLSLYAAYKKANDSILIDTKMTFLEWVAIQDRAIAKAKSKLAGNLFMRTGGDATPSTANPGGSSKQAKLNIGGTKRGLLAYTQGQNKAQKATTKTNSAMRQFNKLVRVQTAHTHKQTVALKQMAHAAKQAAVDSHGLFQTMKRAAVTVPAFYAVAASVMAIHTAFRAAIEEAVKFDNILYQNMAVLNSTTAESKALINTVKQLGSTYGGTFDEIQEGLITLGRAGVDSQQKLSGAVKVLKELSMITGDSMKDGAEIMSSLINVYGKKAGFNIRNVGDQLAYVANETRLGIADFSTLSNYALTAAKSLGLTKESFFALSGAMSKVGLNASTIGTSIRRMQKLVADDTDANIEFFRVLGTAQSEFADALRNDSDATLADFTARLGAMSEERYTRAIKGLPVLLKQAVNSYREIGKNDYFYTMVNAIKPAQKGLEGITGTMGSLSEQAKIMSVGFGVGMERLANTSVISIGKILTTLGHALTGFEGFTETSLSRTQTSIEDTTDNTIWYVKTLFSPLTTLVDLVDTAGVAAADFLKGIDTKKPVRDMAFLEKEYAKIEERIRRLTIYPLAIGNKKQAMADLFAIEDEMIELDFRRKKRIKAMNKEEHNENMPELKDDVVQKVRDADRAMSESIGTINALSNATKASSDSWEAYSLSVRRFQDSVMGTTEYNTLMKAQAKYVQAKAREYVILIGLKKKEAALQQTIANTSHREQSLEIKKMALLNGTANATKDILTATLNVNKAKEDYTRLEAEISRQEKITVQNAEGKLKHEENVNKLREASLKIMEAEYAETVAINSGIDDMATKLGNATDRANSLALALHDAASALSIADINADVLSGAITASQGAILKGNERLKGVDASRLAIKREIKVLDDQLHMKRKNGTKQEDINGIENKRALKLVELAKLSADQLTIEQGIVRVARDITKEHITDAAVTSANNIKQESALKRFDTVKEYRIESKKKEAALLGNEIAKTEKLLKASKTVANIKKYTIDLQELKNKKLLKEQEIAKASIEKTKGATKGDKLKRDAISLLKEQMNLKWAILDLEDTKTGFLFTQMELEDKAIAKAKDRLDIAIATKEAAERAGMPSGDKGRKELLKLEIDVVNARNDLLQKEQTTWKRIATSLKGVARGVFDSIGSGDLAGAFKNATKGIGNILMEPMKESLSTGFANLFKKDGMLGSLLGTAGDGAGGMLGGLGAMSGVLSAGIGMAISMIPQLLSSAPSQREIDAAKGVSADTYTDESLANIAEALKTAQYPMLEVTNKMFKHIRSMDENFNSIARAISGVTSTSGIDITGGGFVDGIYDGGFLSTKSRELIGAGLVFKEQTLQALSDINDIYVQGYESIKTTKSYLWKTKVTLAVKKFDLPRETIEDFSNAFANGYETILVAGTRLGLDKVDLENALNEATIQLGDKNGKIDLSGVSASGLSDALNNIFGTAFSQVVDQIGEFDMLVDRYATGMEGSLETILRIGLEYDQAAHSFNLIGKQFTESTVVDYMSTWVDSIVTEAGRSLNSIPGVLGNTMGSVIDTVMEELVTTTYTKQMQILDIVESTGGLQNFQDAMGSFMSGFYTDAEQVDFLTKSMEVSFNTLGISGKSIPKTNKEFRTLLETMDTTTEEGNYLYGQVLLLADGFNQMTSAADNLGTSVADGIKAIADAWLGSLSYLTEQQKTLYAAEYAKLGLEDTSGNIDNVEAARLAAETAMKTTATKEDYIPVFERYILALEEDIEDEATLDDVVSKLDELIDATEGASYQETLGTHYYEGARA